MDNYRSSSDGLIIGAVALIFFIMIFVGISMSMRGPSQCGLYGHRAPKYLSLNPNQAEGDEDQRVTSERRRERLQVSDTKPLESETLQGDRIKKANVTSTGRGGSQVQLSKAIGRGVTGETGVADTIRRNEEIRKQNLNMDNVRTETSFKKARLAGKIGILNEKHPEFLQNTNYSPDNAYNIATSLITDEGPLDSYFRNLDCSQFGAKDFVPDFHPCNEKLRQESQKRMEILNTRANEGFVRRAVVDTVAPFRGPVGRAIEGPRRFV